MIIEETTLKRHVWTELDNAGVILPRSGYAVVRKEITSSGRQEFARLKIDVGEKGLKLLSQKLNTSYPKDHLIRILGFGSALTRYAVQPVPGSAETTEQVITLGARANLIVTVFDQMIDSGENINRVLPFRGLEALLKHEGKSNWSLFPLFGNRSSKWIMHHLIKSYLMEINRLSSSPLILPGNTPVLKTLIDLIQRMYQAETDTLSKNGLSIASLNRKAALPFVIMGLPAWLSKKDFNQAFYFAHFRWLYRLGLFFGAIDDIIDLQVDISNDQPNQFKPFIENNTVSDSSMSNIGQKIVSEAKLITQQWQHWVNSHNLPIPEYSMDIFSACIVSWFGGSKNYDF